MPKLFNKIFHRRRNSAGEQSQSADPSPARRASDHGPPPKPPHATYPTADAPAAAAAQEPAEGIHAQYPNVTAQDVDGADLWDCAYQELRSDKDTAKLTEIYEKVLTGVSLNSIKINQYANEAAVRNNLDMADDGPDRAARMKEISLMSLKIARSHESLDSGIAQVVELVKGVEKVVAAALAAYPPASFVWAGICAILPIILSPSTQRLSIIQGLNHVMERTEWYMAVSAQLFDMAPQGQHHHRLSPLVRVVKSKAIELFKALLKYEMKCVCACYNEGTLTTAIKSVLADDWKTELETVTRLELEVDGYMSQFSDTATAVALDRVGKDTSGIAHILSEVKALRGQGDEEKRAQSETRRMELMAKFSTETTCSYYDRMMAIPKRVAGTCDWVQSHQKYQTWLRSSEGGILLLSADPGCGKSVLSRFLVEEAVPASLPRACVLYFFFTDSPDQNSLPAALCALIHQLLSARPELADLVHKDVTPEGAGLVRKERVLWKIFERLVRSAIHQEPPPPPSPPSGRPAADVVCVLDALDECQKHDRETLVELLNNLSERNLNAQSQTQSKKKNTSGKVRFLITTRGYPEIVALFSRFSGGYIRLAGENKDEVDQIQNEIATVAEHKLEQLATQRGFTEKKREQIRRSLMVKGGDQRTYLWVRLVFDVLEENLRDQLLFWNKLIDEVPQTVYDAYERLLTRVRNDDRERVMMLLRMMVAAYRPIPLTAAVLLLNAREYFDCGFSAGNEDLEWETEENFKSWVIGRCGFFVTIYDGQLFFIHQTAKEFLLSAAAPPQQTPASPSTFRESITEKDAHRAMAENCLAIWKYKSNEMGCGGKAAEPSSRADDAPPDRPAVGKQSHPSPDRYEYCLTFWAQHFRDAQIFTRSAAGPLSVLDIGDEFWETYLAAWRDEPFIKSQNLQKFLARHDHDAYRAQYTADTRLAFVALYGHYRLLETELGSMGSPDGQAFLGPCLLSNTWVQNECAGLLSRYFPFRPVLVLSEPETE